MATASATVCPATFTASCGRKTEKRANKVVYITGLNSYGGLKAQNNVVSLGLPVSTEQCYANLVHASKTSMTRAKGRSGGSGLAAKCGAVDEIFRIAAIMNGLTLVGVAVGFVLLRIEAFVEESEEA